MQTLKLDYERTMALGNAMGSPLADHLRAGLPKGDPQLVFEALNALASLTSLVLAGVCPEDRQLALDWFTDAVVKEGENLIKERDLRNRPN